MEKRFIATLFIGPSLLASTNAFASGTTQQEGQPASSAAEERSGNEIIVTAQRRSESLTSVPLSISALTEEALVSSGIQEISALSRTTPGLLTQQGVGYTQIYIRGIGNAIYLGADPSVATFIDDTPRIYGSLVNSFINVERVEVLKGAQGGLYGRNATGGVINIITKQPGDELEMQGRISVGERQTVDAAAYVNIPINDTIAVNLSVARKYHDAYIGNVARANPYPPGPLAEVLNAKTSVPKLNNQNFGAIDGKIRFQLSDILKVTLGGDFARKRDANGNGWYQAEPDAAYATYVGFMTSFGAASAILPQSQVFPVRTKKFTGSVLGDAFTDIDDYGGYAKVELALPGFDINSITSFRWNKTGHTNDSGAAAVPLIKYLIFNQKRNFSQEIRAVSNGSGPFQWLAGATYLEDHFRANNNASILDIYESPLTRSLTQTRAWSAYAQGSYDLADRLTLTGSLRYVEENRTVTYSTSTPVESLTLKSNKLLPSATLSYAIDHGTIYARYAKGFKTGGVNPLVPPSIFSSTAGSLFKPEQVDTYEAGYRARLFDGQLQFTSAVFYNDYKNIQVVGSPRRAEITYTIVNAQSARTYGAEVGLTWSVGSALTVSANLGYLNARYKVFNVPAQPDLIASDNSGNRMQFSPKWQGSITANLDQPMNDDLRLVSNILYSYIGSYFFEERNLKLGQQEAYSLVNARIGVATTDNKLGLYLFANNLFNKEYNAFGSVGTIFGTQFVPGDRRIAGAMLEFNF